MLLCSSTGINCWMRAAYRSTCAQLLCTCSCIVLSTVKAYTALCAGLWCWLTSSTSPRRVPTRVSPRHVASTKKENCAQLTLVRAEAARVAEPARRPH
eukprot:10393432-Alexandrium_andersonii.AAC.1